MVAPPSQAAPDRREARRQQTVEDALDRAVEIMAEVGVGGLTVSGVARRLGMRAPSLYKYFPSLHALYDALFARGLAASHAVLEGALEQVSTYVEAPPEVVYDLVSDVTRSPEHSPELLRCTWLDGATGPAVGARFAAVNKAGRRGPA